VGYRVARNIDGVLLLTPVVSIPERELIVWEAKVWGSYVENRTPGTWRIWWMYGPNEIRDNQTIAVITVLDIGPHP
jgi:hypothetical protein